MSIQNILTIAETVNSMDEAHIKLRLRELEKFQDEKDGLTFEELAELNYICMKILTLKTAT